MAHPYEKFRQAEHGKERAKQFTSKNEYARGGQADEVGDYNIKDNERAQGRAAYHGSRFEHDPNTRAGRSRDFEPMGSEAGGDVGYEAGRIRDRKGSYARGGHVKHKKPSVNVNVIQAGDKDKGPPLPPPGALGLGAPPMPPPGMAPPGAGLPPRPPMKRGGPVKKLAGGRIKMTGGAEGGLGRLQMARAAKLNRRGG